MSQWKLVNENNINIFSQKMLACGKWYILAPKMNHPYNSGFALKVFSNFAQWMGLIVHGSYINCLSEKKSYLG